MPFNLLLLPLLGGYWLLRRCNRTRFLLARQDVQRVLLWSATAGFALLVLAALTTSGFIAALDALRRSGDESALSLWHGFSPFAHSGKAVLALLLGGFLPHAFNRAFWWKWDRPDIWARKATEFYGDETEALILRAQDFQMPILITLKPARCMSASSNTT